MEAIGVITFFAVFALVIWIAVTNDNKNKAFSQRDAAERRLDTARRFFEENVKDIAYEIEVTANRKVDELSGQFSSHHRYEHQLDKKKLNTFLESPHLWGDDWFEKAVNIIKDITVYAVVDIKMEAERNIATARAQIEHEKYELRLQTDREKQETRRQAQQAIAQAEREKQHVLLEYLHAKRDGKIHLSPNIEKHLETLWNKTMENRIPHEYVSSIMADYLTVSIAEKEKILADSQRSHERERALTIREIRKETTNIIRKILLARYKFEEKFIKNQLPLESNIQTIPHMSKIYADLCTIDIDIAALMTTSSQKSISLHTLRSEMKDRIEKLKWSEYQLQYLLSLYPTLQDVIETECTELRTTVYDVKHYDPIRRYISKEEWDTLSTVERNQLALDRYVESHRKSKWQIGRDYELYIGYLCESEGYHVDYYGSYMGLEDLGRDLICKKGKKVLLVQCKYWSQEKHIHEKHIMQLYGSFVEYQIEHDNNNVAAILITNTVLSDMAKKFADVLGIKFCEKVPLGDFPRIKCNIGHDEFGNKEKIYHLPMDQQYDRIKLDKPGEIQVMAVAEAENAGFRRAYRWHNHDI